MQLYHDKVYWQQDCDEKISTYDNVIISAPTGSGKTERYESWAFNKKERPVFITSPIKSLSNQRFRQLQEKGYSVALETGDIKVFPEEDADVICCTQEIYNNKYRSLPNVTLIVDEFSYIFDEPGRARAYVDSLYYSKAKNILICSATLGDINLVQRYLENLTNRTFFLYETKERLTSLEYRNAISRKDIRDSLVVAFSNKKCEEIALSLYKDRVEKYNALSIELKYDIRDNLRKKVSHIAKKYDIKNDRLIAMAEVGIVYYFGALYPKEKLFIEELFENSIIDTIVGTDALALGVNFPIKNVVFAQLKKLQGGKEQVITKALFEQLTGRAGRKGYFDEGFVYFCGDFCETSYERQEFEDNFLKLVNSDMPDLHISLRPNIKDILTGYRSIDEEVDFILKYSTECCTREEEKEKIEKSINFIKNYSIVGTVLKKRYPRVNFNKGFLKAISVLNKSERTKIEKLSIELMYLQPVFDDNISKVYMEEYSPAINCEIFTDILMKVPFGVLLNKYGKKFHDILLLRKYMNFLPEEFSSNYDLDYINNEIERRDFTALHPDKVKIEKNSIRATQPKREKKYIYRGSGRLDRILIDEVPYIKIISEQSHFIACEYHEKGRLRLSKISNASYPLISLETPESTLNILNRLIIDPEVLSLDNIAYINGMKASLSMHLQKKKKIQEGKVKSKKKKK